MGHASRLPLHGTDCAAALVAGALCMCLMPAMEPPHHLKAAIALQVCSAALSRIRYHVCKEKLTEAKSIASADDAAQPCSVLACESRQDKM